MTELDVKLNGLEQLKVTEYELRTGTAVADAGLSREGGLIGAVLWKASPPRLLSGAVRIGEIET